MASSFGAISVGLSGLHAARKGLDVTGHNIANVGTDGYTRQRVSQTSVGSSAVPAFHSKGDGVGSGVLAGDTTRLVDAFLEVRALSSAGDLAQLEVLAAAQHRIEDAFNEPGEAGLQGQLDAMWASWDDVANRPGDLSARNQVLEQAEALADGVRRVAADLDLQRANSIDLLEAKVAELGGLAERVAELNGAIREGVLSGVTPNDLMDERDRLVRSMGQLAGVTTKDAGNGVTDVYIGGTAIVRADEVNPVELEVTATGARVVWSNGGYEADVRAGTIGGLRELLGTTLPSYRQALDDVAAALVDVVGAAHAAGFDLAGDPGLEVFIAVPGDEAATLTLNPALRGRPELLAASGTAGTLDGSVAARIAELPSGAGSPDKAYRSLINRMGIEGQSLDRQLMVQTQIDHNAAAARQAASGVNLDEEMTSLVMYQHAYDAAARYISTVDRTLESLMGILR